MKQRPLTAVDLFAGAGGFSLGALNAGMAVVAALENDRNAVRTYKRNLVDSGLAATRIFPQDIMQVSPADFVRDAEIPELACDLLMGGPPCQGFSAHRLKGAGVDDPRNFLLLRYFEYVRKLRPRMFIVENVPGLLWEKHRPFLKKFYATARAAGYTVFAPVVLNACDYGVPQNRRRVFILGYDGQRDPPNIEWPPKPTHVSCEQREEGDDRPLWCQAKVVFDPALPGDPNDFHMQHNAELTAVFASTPPNGGSRSQAKRQLACHRNHDGHSDVYGRIDSTKPGPTMTTACINPSKGRFVHPTENHGITLRQAARFQGFPDWFVFEGGLIAGGVQIGNAVPVGLATALLRPIAAALYELSSASEFRLRAKWA